MSQQGSGYGGYGGPPGGGPPGGAPPGYPPGGGGPGYPPGGGPPGYPPGGGGPPGYPPGGGGPPGYPPGGGGYGPPQGGPPGYGGPPQGGPPGYGGPPQGGPPGYGGPPQGGPPGYGPPQGAPGYPQGGANYGAAPAPAKKSNALLFVGIGCGVLFLLGIVGAGVSFYLAKRATENALSALSAAAAPLTPPGSPGAAPGSATDSSGAPVTGACAQAAECCRKIMQKNGAGAQGEAGCLAMKQLADADCQQPLQAYRASSKLLGVSCD